jgi:hypothetical protein
MNRLDIQRAEKILDALGGRADTLLKQLAGYFRQTGLISTLRWLERKNKDSGPALAQHIEKVIGMPRQALEQTPNTRDHFQAVQKAGPLIEALHITHRARSMR